MSVVQTQINDVCNSNLKNVNAAAQSIYTEGTQQ